MSKVFNRIVKLCGFKKNSTLKILLTDQNNKVLFCTGTAIPTGAGYAKGCIFIKTNASTNGNYQNEGSETSASFVLVTAADIADNAVTLAKLATGILPSHIVKFFVLGSTITGVTLTGLAVGDLIVTIAADGNVSVATCATINTLPSDPADTSYLIVFRAVA